MRGLPANRRLLVVDETPALHEDLRRILGRSPEVGPPPGGVRRTGPRLPAFQIASAYRCGQALRLVEKGLCGSEPFVAALVALHTPPACDGLETAVQILRADPDLPVVLCAALPDCSLDQLLDRFGLSGRLLLLEQPSDAELGLLVLALAQRGRPPASATPSIEKQVESDACRVMTIIEGCLSELEGAHCELRQQSMELSSRLQQRTVEVLGTRDLAMFALAQLADSRDPETGEHLLRMRAYAQLLAEHVSKQGPYAGQIDEAFLEDFYRSTPLHDIGKVGIPDQILLKPGRLTEQEFEIMKQHTVIGAEALEKAARQNRFGSFLGMASEIARWHHERFDGSGYPDGLERQAIPLSARITSLADVFDALASPRVYKEALPVDQARRIIEDEDGKQFDPVIVAAFRDCFDEFLWIKESIDNGTQTAPEPIVRFDHPLPLFTAAPASG